MLPRLTNAQTGDKQPEPTPSRCTIMVNQHRTNSVRDGNYLRRTNPHIARGHWNTPSRAMHSIHLQLTCRRPTSRHFPSNARQGMPQELQPMNIPTDCSPLHITRTIRTITSAPPQPMPTYICLRCHIAITVRMNLDVFPSTSDSLQNASATAASKHIMCWSHRLSDPANRLHRLTSLHSAHRWPHNSITTHRSVYHAQQSSNART